MRGPNETTPYQIASAEPGEKHVPAGGVRPGYELHVILSPEELVLNVGGTVAGNGTIELGQAGIVIQLPAVEAPLAVVQAVPVCV